MSKSQKQKILELLRKRKEKGVGSYESFDLRIKRLAARIHDLKRDGHAIITKRKNNSREVVYILGEYYNG